MEEAVDKEEGDHFEEDQDTEEEPSMLYHKMVDFPSFDDDERYRIYR